MQDYKGQGSHVCTASSFRRCLKRSYYPLAVTLIIATFLAKSWTRSHDWLSEEALFRSGLRVCPNNAKEGIDSFVKFKLYWIITSYSAVPNGLQCSAKRHSPGFLNFAPALA